MGISGGIPTRQPDWRNRSHYDYTASLSRQGWAWEFLRRNPDYRQDFDRMMREHPNNERDAALLHRWGLRFRERPELQRP